MKQRIGTVFLCLCLILTVIPLPVFAAGEIAEDSGVPRDDTRGLCEHHPDHTGWCNYSAGETGSPCTHVHDEGCQAEEIQCIHTHTEGCFSGEMPEPGEGADLGDEPSSAVSDGSSEADAETDVETESEDIGSKAEGGSEPAFCDHECSEESGCVTVRLECPHAEGAHDETCGYKEAEDGAPGSCSYVCPICAEQTPDLEEGEWAATIRGSLLPGLSAESPADLLSSPAAAAKSAAGSRSDVSDRINHYINVYVNGKLFKDGQQIDALVGDSFSYQLVWSPNAAIGSDDFFDIELFRVPGLNFQPRLSSSLIIDNVKVGEWSLAYDKTVGSMIYHVEFNRYVQFFDPLSILASLQGNATFQGPQNGTPIQVGDASGTLNVEERPTKPVNPYPPGGTGWKPQTPPVMNSNLYPFGKGVKWTSSKNPNVIPQIDWRSPFLTLLQERQSEFLTDPDTAVSEVNGNCLIEDKLDLNQRFFGPNDGGRFRADAPFNLELPVIVPGTGSILNGGAGNGSYDGVGEIAPYVAGDSFVKIDGSKVATAADMAALRARVEGTPMSWAVYTDPRDGLEVLYINVGTLGVKRGENAKGINWDMARGSQAWPEQGLQNLINKCDKQIESLENGLDSPLALMDSRRDALLNLLRRAVSFSANAVSKDDAQAALDQWSDAYIAWRATPGIDPLSQLTDPDGALIPMPALPDPLLEGLAEPGGKGGTVAETAEYKNFISSYQNLYADQATYLDNRASYRNGWEDIKQTYQDTLEFYKDGQVFGFVIKVWTRVSNPSMNTYSNNISVSVGDRQWTASDESRVTFANSISGNYALGTSVFQKADALYDTDSPDEEDIKNVQKEKAGLVGAKFQVYCEDPGNGFVKDEKHLAHFLEKEASQNQDTYRYTHTGVPPSGPVPGEVNELEVGDDGRLSLGNLSIAHKHYLVETVAPDGYYLDEDPIEVQVKRDDVIYSMAPNVSRAVKLSKADSYSSRPVQGAQFSLSRVEGGITTVLSFSEKTINGHKTYWPDNGAGGSSVLVTDEEGNLCVHGLGAGEYKIEETQPAPGYKDPAKAVQLSFELEDALPKDKTGYDSDWHYLITEPDPLTNDPKTTDISFEKRDINGTLQGAGYALFRFKGSEAEWQKKEESHDIKMWEPVGLTKDAGAYFHTDNSLKKASIPFQDSDGSDIDVQVTLAQSGADGAITITDIPVGHYTVSEIEAPDPYIRDYSNYYFHVNGDTIGEPIRLYRTADIEAAQQVQGNALYNYTDMTKLALIKYDAGETQPTLIDGVEITGSPIDGVVWEYQDPIATTGGKPLSGAVYKLFQRTFGDKDINPHPKELTSTEIQYSWNRVYDYCLAVGKTDKNGVLKLDDMTDKDGNKVYEGEGKGLPMGSYYLLEVKPPEGYRLIQDPVWFTVESSAFPADKSTPGLIRMASNTTLDYGLQIVKSDAVSGAALEGAEFSLARVGEDAPIAFSYDSNEEHYYVDDQGSTSLATRSDGTFTAVGLTPGEYILTEARAPQGYKKAAPKKVKIEKFTSSTTDGLVIQKVEVKDERLKGQVSLYKTDWETLQPLPGAKFQLYRVKITKVPETDPSYDPDIEYTYTEEIPIGRPIVTDDAGEVFIDDLEWTDGQDFYYLQELESPEGYVTNSSRLQFTIDATSFYEDGTPVPVVFRARNAKGISGKVTVHKVDSDDPDKKLEDAHFFLTREVQPDVWIAYGKGIYVTDADGKFTIPLPPGNYALKEMKAPDDYLGDLGEYHFFTVDDRGDNTEPKPIELQITNNKGDAGVYLKKTVAHTDIPIPGVEFQFFQGNLFHHASLYFEKEKDGLYRCVGTAPVDDAVTGLATDSKGELRLIFGSEYLVDPNNPLDALNKGIFYQEASAPDGVKVNDAVTMIQSFDPMSPGCLQKGFWSKNLVSNELKDDAGSPSIILSKEGEDGKPLAGAKFKLYFKLNDMEIPVFEEATGVDGQIIFQAPNALSIGSTYYIQEIEAPEGYVLNDTVYEVTLGEDALDPDFHFQPVYVDNGTSVKNERTRGTVELIKVDEDSKPLAGAEFELLRQTEGGTWERYGDALYMTDSDGRIALTLPSGSHRWIERKAPAGYLLDIAEHEFTLVADGQHVTVGPLENKLDPTPRGDVTVVKSEQGSPGARLEGARFQLYFLGEDGSYHLDGTTVYTSDMDGRFTVTDLLAGSYAFREVEAPEGYELSDRFWPFSISKMGEVVTLSVTNSKETEEGGGSGSGEGSGPGEGSDPGGGSNPGGGSGPGESSDPGGGSDPGSGRPGLDKFGELYISSNGYIGANPKTGELTGALFWIVLMAGGAVGLAFALGLSHRRRNLGRQEEKEED